MAIIFGNFLGEEHAPNYLSMCTAVILFQYTNGHLFRILSKYTVKCSKIVKSFP